MPKKSRVVALLVVCVMRFAVVEPACAFWGEDTLYGAGVGGAYGGFWGGVLCAVVTGTAIVTTGGLALLPAAVAIGGAAATGAVYGAGTGAVLGAGVGAVTDKETVDACPDGITKIAEAVATGVIAGGAIGGSGSGSYAPQPATK